MQVVCEATQVKDTPVKVAALQCLVKIMSLYYIHMEAYMGTALFAVSTDNSANVKSRMIALVKGLCKSSFL